METLLKQPYEISLWDDRLTAVYEDGTETQEFVDAQENIVAQYYKEFKICVIGSDTMDSPFKVVEPKLVRKTDGTSTLTFSIYTNCYNEESGEFEINPFVKYLTNERKVKLKYFPNGEMAWIDFVIKKVDETSENYKFTYTATDLFINELSKTGYNLEFDKELENGQGTIQQLAAEILSSSEWMVGIDSETIQQVNDEPIYAIKLNQPLKCYDIFTNTEKIIGTGEVIYAFYSSVNNLDSDPSYFQFIYNEDGIYNADENNIIYDVGNYYCNKNDVNDETELYNGFRAEKYIRTQKSTYDKTAEKYVNIYTKDGNEYYGYVDTKYFSPSLVTNYITNGESIIYSSGWRQQNGQDIDITTDPPVTQQSNSRIFGIKYVQSANNNFLVNSGFRDNAEIIKEISLNQKFVFGIKGKKLLEGQKYRCRVCRFTKDSEGKYTLKDELFNTSDATLIKLEDSNPNFNIYYFKNISPQYSLSYEKLTDITLDKFGIFIDVINGNREFFIEKAELFQQFDGKAQDRPDENGIVLPSGKILYEDGTISEEIASSQIINTYYYYEPNSNISKIEEINYTHIGEQDDSFEKVYDYNFEKVRSISKKETNRFDLLQTLSETFECWCRFDVWHDEEGRIILGKDLDLVINSGNAFSKEKIIFLGGNSYTSEEVVFMNEGESNVYSPYQQLKFVTFHKRIGQKKNIGFKYGINLKSISRSLDSNDIATKLIVKSNTNEFAEGGSCNIALAEENPSGENFVYDFSYYINKGLLNQDNLDNDLYYFVPEGQEDSRKWIGLYVKLKILNKRRDKLITEQSGLVGQYAKYKSTYENAKIQSNATSEELEDLRAEYISITGDDDGYNGSISEQETSEKIKALAVNIERLTKQDKDLKESFKKAKEEMDRINERLEALNSELQDIEQQTSTLIKTFETKYIRFIQEASWTSEDYIDNNLYYLDAETTLHKSSQPKVSYTFNVIDLSRIEEYQDYSFDIGDITHVEDTEFFGWKYKNGVKIPRKEEIVVTEQTIFFDSPEKNTFKAQNYRTAFEDLFQRLTASSQQLQFHSGEFQRAADVIDSNGNIAPSCLEDAFSNNAYLLSNAANQTVKWDEFGITTTDSKNPAEIVRITSGGMFLSEDGGEEWTTGITARGINAKTITTGVLNTGLVNIYNGAQKSFVWDSQGLNAYKLTDSGYSQNSFVRFDQNGLMGQLEGEKKFEISWDGIKIYNNTGNSVFYADDNGNLQITGIIYANGGQIGGWTLDQGTTSGKDWSQLTAGDLGADGSIHLYTYFNRNELVTIGGHPDKKWRLTIGPNFGINNMGYFYCNHWRIDDGGLGQGGYFLTVTDNNDTPVVSFTAGGIVFYTGNVQNAPISWDKLKQALS